MLDTIGIAVSAIVLVIVRNIIIKVHRKNKSK